MTWVTGYKRWPLSALFSEKALMGSTFERMPVSREVYDSRLFISRSRLTTLSSLPKAPIFSCLDGTPEPRSFEEDTLRDRELMPVVVWITGFIRNSRDRLQAPTSGLISIDTFLSFFVPPGSDHTGNSAIL